jgi:DNA-binding FadR family transcriptional regulator
MMIEAPGLRPLRSGLHRDLVDALGRRIVKGLVLPGESFPNEADLSAELGVSRTVIREAMKVLASKGLVSTRPKTGTRVLPRARWNLIDPDVLHWQFGEGVDEGLLQDLSEVRLIVEPGAAALAAERRTDEDLRDIVELLEAMGRSVDDTGAYIRADLDFHGAILSAAHNDLLARMAATIQEALIASSRKVRVAGGPSEARQDHIDLVSAIKARDRLEASRAMQRLVRATWNDMQTILRSDGARTGL